MQVSVRELRDHLSQYLHQTNETNQPIIVMSHSVPIARLIPIARSKGKDETKLLLIEGVSWNGKKPKGSKKRPKLKGNTAADYVLEDRR